MKFDYGVYCVFYTKQEPLFLSQLKNVSFDLNVNLLKRLRHRLSIKAKIKCQSADL